MYTSRYQHAGLLALVVFFICLFSFYPAAVKVVEYATQPSTVTGSSNL